MLKSTTLILCLITFNLFGQEDKDYVREWTQNNTQIKLISETEYKAYSDDIKLQVSLIEDKIIYSEFLRLNDIEKYQNATNKLSPRTDVEYVFHWLQANAGVKIISHSVFSDLNSEKQLMYLNTGAMVLIGEEISKADIAIFENHTSN